MPSLIESLGHFIASIFHAITAALGSVLAVFQSIFNAILGVIATAFDAVGTTVKGLANTFEGLFKFLLSESQPIFACLEKVKGIVERARLTNDTGNIVVIGGVVAVFFLYTMYQQRNGRPVTAAPAGRKKIN